MRKQFIIRLSVFLLLGTLLASEYFVYASSTSYGIDNPESAKLIDVYRPTTDTLQSPEGNDEKVYNRLSELEVTATSNSREISSVAPLHFLGRAEISTQGIVDISDALQRIPGVSVTDYGGSGSLKNLSVRGLGSRHTGVVYDHFPISDIQSGSVDLSRYSLWNVESLTVYSGDDSNLQLPARALSSAASLNLVTVSEASGSDSLLRIRAGADIGSFFKVAPFFSLGYSNGKNLSTNASGWFDYAKNNFPFIIRNGNQYEKHDREHAAVYSGGGQISANYKVNPKIVLGGKAYYYGSNKELPGPVIYYLSNSNENLTEENAFGQGWIRASISDRVMVRGGIKYNYSTTHYTDINGIYPDGKLDKRYRQEEWYFTTGSVFDLGKGWEISYMLDFFHNALQSGDSCPYRKSFLQALSGKWKHSFWEITCRLLFSNFMNYGSGDYGSKRTGRISPSVAFSFRVLKNQDFFIRGSYKNIFRLPTFNELYFEHYGTVNLNPEDADVWNFGLTYGTLSDAAPISFSVIADSFISRIRNQIVAIPYNMFVYTMTNLGKVLTTGMEISVSMCALISSRHKLIIRGNYSLQEARIRTSRNTLDWNCQLAYTPRNSGSGSLTWMNPWITPIIHVVAYGERYTNNLNLPDNRLEGYWNWGVSFNKSICFGTHEMVLRLYINNLFNRQYQIISGYPMPGRNWGLNFEYKFNRR